MIIISPSAEELQAAGRVASCAELDAVRLVGLVARNEGFAVGRKELTFDAAVSFTLIGSDLVAPNRFEVTSGLRLDLTDPEAPSAGGRGKSVGIEVSFLTSYRLPDAPMPDEIRKTGLPAFARYNALFNSWPYFRQQVQYIIGAMGLPPFVLPPLVIRPKRLVVTELQPVQATPPPAKSRKAKGVARRRQS